MKGNSTKKRRFILSISTKKRRFSRKIMFFISGPILVHFQSKKKMLISQPTIQKRKLSSSSPFSFSTIHQPFANLTELSQHNLKWLQTNRCWLASFFFESIGQNKINLFIRSKKKTYSFNCKTIIYRAVTFRFQLL